MTAYSSTHSESFGTRWTISNNKCGVALLRCPSARVELCIHLGGRWCVATRCLGPAQLPKLLKPGGIYSFFSECRIRPRDALLRPPTRDCATRDFSRPEQLSPGPNRTLAADGLAPDNTFFHATYGRLVQLELGRLGFTTRYEKVDIKEAIDPAVWEGVANKYWHLPFYMLPTCIFGGDQQQR